MKIFLSYGNRDLGLVERIAQNLKPFGEVFYWNKDKAPGQDSWKTIFLWIDSSDIVVPIITGKVVERAMSVGQEVGRAVAKDKLVLPLVTHEVPVTDLGCLNGITYQRLNLDDPHEAIAVILRVIDRKRSEKEKNDAILVIGAIIALFVAASN